LAFVTVSGIIFIFSYVLLLALRVAAAERGETLRRPGMWVGYLTCILAHTRAICENIIFIPFLGGCLKQFQGKDGSSMLSISALGFLMNLGIVYPISIYCSCDSSFLAPNKDRKFSTFNAELFLTGFKPIFILVSLTKQKMMPYLTAIFFVLYMFILMKRPFYAHTGQTIKRACISIVAFVCLSRTMNAIIDSQGSVLT
jgi:hypothetical protein